MKGNVVFFAIFEHKLHLNILGDVLGLTIPVCQDGFGRPISNFSLGERRGIIQQPLNDSVRFQSRYFRSVNMLCLLISFNGSSHGTFQRILLVKHLPLSFQIDHIFDMLLMEHPEFYLFLLHLLLKFILLV